MIFFSQSSSELTFLGFYRFLYGRGVSDDKGPLLATIFATKALLDAGKLDVDVSFIIEVKKNLTSRAQS